MSSLQRFSSSRKEKSTCNLLEIEIRKLRIDCRSAGEDALQRKNNALKPQYYGSETKAFKNRTIYNGEADRIRSSLLPCTKPQSVVCVLKRARLKHDSASTKHPCTTCKLLQLFTSVCGTDARWTTMFITGIIATVVWIYCMLNLFKLLTIVSVEILRRSLSCCSSWASSAVQGDSGHHACASHPFVEAFVHR